MLDFASLSFFLSLSLTVAPSSIRIRSIEHDLLLLMPQPSKSYWLMNDIESLTIQWINTFIWNGFTSCVQYHRKTTTPYHTLEIRIRKKAFHSACLTQSSSSPSSFRYFLVVVVVFFSFGKKYCRVISPKRRRFFSVLCSAASSFRFRFWFQCPIINTWLKTTNVRKHSNK